jgi:hypothetical protein
LLCLDISWVYHPEPGRATDITVSSKYRSTKLKDQIAIFSSLEDLEELDNREYLRIKYPVFISQKTNKSTIICYIGL